MPSDANSFSDFLTVSEMVAFSGLSHQTLRFYEDRGLLQPERVGLVRFYAHRDRIRLELIITGKRLGFSLDEIARLIGEAVVASPKGAISQITKDELARQIDRLVKQREGVQAAIDGLTAAPAAKDVREPS